jgi:nucleotide-binding universal stress UspA family protein
MPSRGLRLLVAVDFSAESLRALRAARRLRTRADGSITLLHVRPSSDTRAAVLAERGDLLKRPAGTLKQAIASHYEGRLAALVKAREGEFWKIARGRADVEICREARRGYDMLFMGNRGQGAVSNLLIGSTVQALLRVSPIPVVVHPR